MKIYSISQSPKKYKTLRYFIVLNGYIYIYVCAIHIYIYGLWRCRELETDYSYEYKMAIGNFLKKKILSRRSLGQRDRTADTDCGYLLEDDPGWIPAIPCFLWTLPGGIPYSRVRNNP